MSVFDQSLILLYESLVAAVYCCNKLATNSSSAQSKSKPCEGGPLASVRRCARIRSGALLCRFLTEAENGYMSACDDLKEAELSLEKRRQMLVELERELREYNLKSFISTGFSDKQRKSHPLSTHDSGNIFN